VEKLVEFYRKENKLIGMELFGSKKDRDLLNGAQDMLKTELKLATEQIEILNGSLSLKEQQLI
jgi:hypothetical protein